MSLTEGEDSVCVPWMLKTQDEEDTTKPPLSINAQLLASGLCFFAVSVAFNSYGAASSFASFVDPSVPPEVLSNQQHLLLRIAAGVCGGDCTEDIDADGLCDDIDPCIGTVDACGLCNGPGSN